MIIAIGELLWYAKISTPFAVRDMVVHVYAADCTIEHGCVSFVGKSFDSTENSNIDVEIPPEPSIWSGYRIDVQKMCGVMNILSPTTAKVTLLYLLFYIFKQNERENRCFLLILILTL